MQDPFHQILNHVGPMLSDLRRPTLLTMVEERVLERPRAMRTAGVDPSPRDPAVVSSSRVVAGRESSKTSGRRTHEGSPRTRRLHRHGLAHDGAAVGKDLELGHGAATRGRSRRRRRLLRRGADRRRRERPQGRRRRLLQEGAHGLGLAENGVHGDVRGRLMGSAIVSSMVVAVSLCCPGRRLRLLTPPPTVSGARNQPQAHIPYEMAMDGNPRGQIPRTF